MSGEETNPFADPAVTQVTGQARQTPSNFEDYNPFADTGNQNRVPSQVRGASHPPQYQDDPPSGEPAIIKPVSEPPPTYTPSASQSVNQQDLQKRQQELERKAAELQEREQALRNVGTDVRANNWPPLPAKCCFGPCFYQDISVEIPIEFQKTVRTVYYLWMFYFCVLCLNVIGAFAMFITVGGGTTFGFALLALVLFTPLSFLCWFRPLYKAFRSDSSFNFMVFFFVFFFQTIIAILYAIGIPGIGGCGIVNGLASLQSRPVTMSNYAVGGIVLVIGFLWGVVAVTSSIMLLKIHKIYRNSDASFAKAQEEFAHGVVRNEYVQSAATNAATAAAKQSLRGNRY
ncbi:secretory carrier-associated membrane protein 1-like isoform X1 [Limulus polyphemus]|uniref:Secretory carrier-associated membrane protein n=1 Tax=Limulus polyphemus TaxID=6850 RepID=A0ABM1TDE1_LIMPO|nr:secretory carrier-associated membrane protein 1-like isoform X1 [Limulus polyphemus]